MGNYDHPEEEDTIGVVFQALEWNEECTLYMKDGTILRAELNDAFDSDNCDEYDEDDPRYCEYYAIAWLCTEVVKRGSQPFEKGDLILTWYQDMPEKILDKNGKVIYSEEIRQAHEKERLEREKNAPAPAVAKPKKKESHFFYNHLEEDYTTDILFSYSHAHLDYQLTFEYATGEKYRCTYLTSYDSQTTDNNDYYELVYKVDDVISLGPHAFGDDPKKLFLTVNYMDMPQQVTSQTGRVLFPISSDRHGEGLNIPDYSNERNDIPGNISIFNGDEETAQYLINQKAGYGTRLSATRELVTYPHYVGLWVNQHTNGKRASHQGIIHYSDQGTWIVPAEPLNPVILDRMQ